MLKLNVESPDGTNFDRDIDADSLIVGRSSGSDVVIVDRFLSRKHARIFREGDAVMIEDLGSRNGTIVNKRRIEKPTKLSAGDRIEISRSVISIVDPAKPAAPQTAPSHQIDLSGATVIRSAADLLRNETTTSGGAKTVDEQALRLHADRLMILNDVHKALGRLIDRDQLLDMILDRVIEHLKPEQAVMYLRGPDGDFHESAARRLAGAGEPIALSRSLVEEVCNKQQAALVIDAATDKRFAEAESIVLSGVRSLVAAPLIDQDSTVGMIVLSSRAATRRFEEDDLSMLVSLASVAALRIRNAELAEESARKKRLEEELALARTIQEGLLPDALPQIEGFELYAGNIPSDGVSGDYYQCVERDDCVQLIVADVSGHGMAASLLTASLEALSAGPLENGLPPNEICERVSRRLYARTPSSKFATAFLVRLDPKTGTIVYTNAGHNEGIVVRDDESTELLESTGLPLGIWADAEYGASEATLEPGDMLVIYTDGITEAFNPESEQYGLDRLTAFCVEHRHTPLEEFAVALESAVEEFAQGTPIDDDRTLLVIRRTRI